MPYFPEIKTCTALITPFTNRGTFDQEGFLKLLEFQQSQGVDSLLAAGTTGECPTLTWKEHLDVVKLTAKFCESKGLTCVAGISSNNTAEMLRAAEEIVAEYPVNAFLASEPYYNGPSSLEIRREHFEPLASQFPNILIIPYIIPGRTGCQLLPEDLAILAEKYENVRAMKDSTGGTENAIRIRSLIGESMNILSGDDELTLRLMLEPSKAGGAISVASNIAPQGVSQFVKYLFDGKSEEAVKLNQKLRGLFSIITISTLEQTKFGKAKTKSRNPVPIKTVMRLLGMPAGACRPPLGKMTKHGFKCVLGVLKTIWSECPELLLPIEEFFGVSIGSRLNDSNLHKELFYDGY